MGSVKTHTAGADTGERLRALALACLWWACVPAAGPAGAQDGHGAAGGDGVEVRVFYATNRAPAEKGEPGTAYGGGRGEPRFGVCEVAFRPIPVMGALARKVPFYVPVETREIRVDESPAPKAFWDELSRRVERSASRSIVLFVHGYNYGFERTCRMAAELQRSLGNEAAVVMFSWPSNADRADYLPDLADIEWSVPFLARFIADLAARFGAQNLHLLAHSLGTRGVVQALQRLRADGAPRPALGRLVLLAPDFDTRTFAEILPRLSPLIGSLTIYVSSNDTPLWLSQRMHGHRRLGEAGEQLAVIEGAETIDVSPVGRYEILGHEYFYYHPRVAADLAVLLTTGEDAARRAGLRPRSKDGRRYWELAEP